MRDDAGVAQRAEVHVPLLVIVLAQQLQVHLAHTICSGTVRVKLIIALLFPLAFAVACGIVFIPHWIGDGEVQSKYCVSNTSVVMCVFFFFLYPKKKQKNKKSKTKKTKQTQHYVHAKRM